MSECIHGIELNSDCLYCRDKLYDLVHKYHCEIHNVAYNDQCGVCADEEKPNSQLNEVISNLIRSSTLLMVMVTELSFKMKNLEAAVKELSPKKETPREKLYVFQISSEEGQAVLQAPSEKSLKTLLATLGIGDFIVLSKTEVK